MKKCITISKGYILNKNGKVKIAGKLKNGSILKYESVLIKLMTHVHIKHRFTCVRTIYAENST